MESHNNPRNHRVESLIASVTTLGINARKNTPPHLCRQAPDDVSRDPVPNVDQSLFKFLSVTWKWHQLSQMAVKVIPKVFNGVHVWRVGWPWQDSDVSVLEVVSCHSGNLVSCIVMLQYRSSWLSLEERNDYWSQYHINVSLGSQITSQYDQLGCCLATDPALNHDASASKRMNLSNAVWRETFASSSKNSNSAIIPEETKPAVVCEQHSRPITSLPPTYCTCPSHSALTV